MRYLLWGTAAAIAAVSSTAAGERSWYVGIEAGLTDASFDGGYVQDPGGFLGLFNYVDFGDNDESITLLGTVGAYLTDDLRMELEVGRRAADSRQAEIGQTTLMLNAAYDIPIVENLSFSIGAGGGLDFASVDGPTADESGMMFAYQAMAGLTYEIGDNTDIVLNYRYFVATGPSFGEVTISSGAQLKGADDTTISLGLRFGF